MGWGGDEKQAKGRRRRKIFGEVEVYAEFRLFIYLKYVFPTFLLKKGPKVPCISERQCLKLNTMSIQRWLATLIDSI